jgi:hypothetical protein
MRVDFFLSYFNPLILELSLKRTASIFLTTVIVLLCIFKNTDTSIILNTKKSRILELDIKESFYIIHKK